MIPGIVAGLLASTAITDPPERALAYKSAGQTVSTTAALIFGAEVYDIGSLHSTASNTDRLITPGALSRVVTNSLGGGGNNGFYLEQRISTGGGVPAAFNGMGLTRYSAANTFSGGNCTSAILTIATPGTDYLATYITAGSGNFTPNTEEYTWSFIEKLDAATKYIILSNSANQATPNGGAGLTYSFNTKSGTQTGWHSAGNPTRITPNVTCVRVTGNIVENNAAANTLVKVFKNGVAVYGGACIESNCTGNDLLNFSTAPIPMNGTTDYLEVVIITNNVSSVLTHTASWVCVEEVNPSYARALVSKTTVQNLAANTSNRIYWDTTQYDNASIVQTVQSTVTISIASPGVVTWNAHGLENGDPVKLTTTGALPTGLTANTVYYVVNKTANDFQLALSTGGAAINTSGSQSGTHTCTNRSRLLTPAGKTEARVTINGSFSASTGGVDFANTGASAWATKNRANFRGMPLVGTTGQNTTRHVSAVSAWVPVTALTDAFEMLMNPSAGISRNAAANEYTTLSIEFR
jgi:hypothetical protein